MRVKSMKALNRDRTVINALLHRLTPPEGGFLVDLILLTTISQNALKP